MIGVGDNVVFNTAKGSTGIGKVLTSDDFGSRPLRVQWHSAIGKHIERFNPLECINMEQVH